MAILKNTIINGVLRTNKLWISDQNAQDINIQQSKLILADESGNIIPAKFIADSKKVLSQSGTWIDLPVIPPKYSLPIATKEVLGGVSLYDATALEKGDKIYPVQLNSLHQMLVKVPWTDTNTWLPNTKTQDGYVTKGEGHINSIWMTDHTGAPAWSELIAGENIIIDGSTISAVATGDDVHVDGDNAIFSQTASTNLVIPNNGEITQTELHTLKVGDINYKVADEQYVQTKISELVNSSPETLNTINQLSKVLGNDQNLANNVLNKIDSKQDKFIKNQNIKVDEKTKTILSITIDNSEYCIARDKTTGNMINLSDLLEEILMRLKY